MTDSGVATVMVVKGIAAETRTSNGLTMCHVLFVVWGFFFSMSGALGDASVLTSIKIIEHN